jgi:hypothetical protein
VAKQLQAGTDSTAKFFEDAVFEEWDKLSQLAIRALCSVHVDSAQAESLPCRERREQKILTGAKPLRGEFH